MIRVILVNVLLLFLPTLLYFAYIYLARQDKAADEAVEDAPFLWLIVIGVALMAGGLFFLGNWSGDAPGGKYHPPEFRDGKMVPGYVEVEPRR